MITNENKKISIIAYYLSKFDRDALNKLGYDTYSTAFAELSKIFGKTNSYMKLRRDEFDAIVSKNRQGWNKRQPAPSVLLIHNELEHFSFEEMTNIVNSLINDDQELKNSPCLTKQDQRIITSFDEYDFESIINSTDRTATIHKRLGVSNIRIYNKRIPERLKELYKFKCQICGATATTIYGVDISEAHHIDYFTKSFNNNSNNIVILCPDHHRIIHKANGVFNFDTHVFTYQNGKTEALLYNLHL